MLVARNWLLCMFTFYICLFTLCVGWDQGVLEYQALIWRSENDLEESASLSIMRVQGNLTPGQWQLSVFTGPSRWCTVLVSEARFHRCTGCPQQDSLAPASK